jgi:hypothetical protein
MSVPVRKRIMAQVSKKTCRRKIDDYGRQISESSPQAREADAEQNRQREPEEAAGHSREASNVETGVLTRCRNALTDGARLNQNRCASQSQSDDPKPGRGTQAPGICARPLAHEHSCWVASVVNQTVTRSQTARK